MGELKSFLNKVFKIKFMLGTFFYKISFKIFKNLNILTPNLILFLKI